MHQEASMKGPIFTTLPLLALAGALACDHTSNVAGTGAVSAELVAPAAGSLREPVYYEGRGFFAQLAAAPRPPPNQPPVPWFKLRPQFQSGGQKSLPSPR